MTNANHLPYVLTSLAAAIALAGAAHAEKAPKLDGDWQGILAVPGGTLTVVMHFATKDGAVTASLDSPDQGAMGIPAELKSGDGGKIVVDVSSVTPPGSYTATPSVDGKKLTGEWSQGGQALPLEMVKK